MPTSTQKSIASPNPSTMLTLRLYRRAATVKVLAQSLSACYNSEILWSRRRPDSQRRYYASKANNGFLNRPSHKDLTYQIPQNVRQKVISSSDAVALVRDGDTVCVSGFVCQGAPEAVLKALGERYEESGSPSNLTLLFQGGPGDWKSKGLNHLAKTKDGQASMLRRTIGGHYGQVPKVADLVLSNQVEGWTLPMGSISRMIRAQSAHAPGHITTIGLGTYVDPELSGGASNAAARQSPLHETLVRRLTIDNQVRLVYKALPINVAIIRGTTADANGNLTLEHESLLCDQKNIAAAAKNSGGVVIAQVKRLAAVGSLPCRSVDIPGTLVDCIVVVDEDDHDELHPMSYEERYNPALTGEVVTPQDEVVPMPLSIRKLIARRAFFGLQPNKLINLGIGLPEGVASVAAEEGMLKYITLSTEPGVFGGLPASGRSFGPAINASALIEMNQMFDFYNGGGLDMCFLGAAQISKNGDVNVSRMSCDRLTGPGGFIDITQSTRMVCFMATFTTGDLEVSMPGDGTLKIEKEGRVKKFVPEVFEKTFSGDEAVRRGQTVHYVTERAVFRRSAQNDVLELIEIAPGVDLQRDVLDQMDFEPVISPNLVEMDRRIFVDEKMDVISELFGSLQERCTYHAEDHTLFVELFGISLNTEDDVRWFTNSLRSIVDPLVEAKGPIHAIIQYDGFDVRKGLEDMFSEEVAKTERDYYASVKRFTGASFHRAKLAKKLRMSEWDVEELYDEFDLTRNGKVSLNELRKGFADLFSMELTSSQLNHFKKTEADVFVDREMFAKGVEEVLKSAN